MSKVYEHLHPAALKGLGLLASPLTRPWRKTCPTPLHKRGLDCQGSSNFPFHSLSLRVSIAPYYAHIPDSFWPQPLVLRTGNISDTFFDMKSEEATNGGGCCVKKIGCKLGAFQRPFREPTFLRQGGDALTSLMRHSFIQHPQYHDTFLRGQRLQFQNSLFYTTTTLDNTISRISVLSC